MLQNNERTSEQQQSKDRETLESVTFEPTGCYHNNEQYKCYRDI